MKVKVNLTPYGDSVDPYASMPHQNEPYASERHNLPFVISERQLIMPFLWINEAYHVNSKSYADQEVYARKFLGVYN